MKGRISYVLKKVKLLWALKFLLFMLFYIRNIEDNAAIYISLLL